MADTNNCGDCGHVWVPRTKTVSTCCPHCRSTDTHLDRDYFEALQSGVGTVFAVAIIITAVPPLALVLLPALVWQGVDYWTT